MDLKLLGAVAVCTILLVGFGSFYKISQLQSGGRVIAESLGGQLIDSGTTGALERKVLNVVEEMSVASGTPTPPVYLLNHERGINAFAAGFSPSDAVIGVTRGSVERLTRDQLQGVIAHEFSHILNGDMRLNIRLIGVVHGILVISLIGQFVLRSAFYSGATRRRSSKENPLPLIALGAALMAIGFLGMFFGNLIKAAVSRQREFLADAAAVQFTRNPRGIGGALMQIGGFSKGSAVQNPNAPEASHMFFGQAIASGLNAFFATHPPLTARIARIDPSWDGTWPDVNGAETPEDRTEVDCRVAPFAGAATPVTVAAFNQIGQPTEAHVHQAVQLLQSLPESIHNAVREPYGARAVIYTMLLDAKPEPRRIQLEKLAKHADPGVYRQVEKLLDASAQVHISARLP
ncbi:MAG: M48 family metallopeptidase, partial [Pirellulaceae bacterium]|nr:M48 family metallopeptidase [Pirellulaceae bacterium]